VYYSYSLAAGVKEGYIYNLTQNGLWKNKILHGRFLYLSSGKIKLHGRFLYLSSLL